MKMASRQYRVARRKMVKSKMCMVTIRKNDIVVNQKENNDLAKYQKPWGFPLKAHQQFPPHGSKTSHIVQDEHQRFCNC